MATTKNLKETESKQLYIGDGDDILTANGWFYHAPSKPKPNAEPADLPAPSQIPGLSGDNMPYNPMEEPKKMLIKETDSPYIRMAKKGGREDLLRMRTPTGGSKVAKPYARTDWFYLEDNRMEDEMEKQRQQDRPYEFSLPDYMVHHDYKPHGDVDPHSHGRNPLSRDTSTVYDREGNAATDKTVRVQESRPSGYGVRQEKQKERRQKMPAMGMPERAKAPHGELDVQRPGNKNIPKPHEEERPLMSKILSFGYGKDDLEERQKWKHQQEMSREAAHQDLPQKTDKSQTENHSSMATKKGRTPTYGRRAGSGHPSEAGSQRSQRSQYARQKQHTDAEKPDFFKLSKFQNVPAKVNSNRCAEEIEPMAYNPTRDLSDLHVSPQLGHVAAN